MHDESLDGSSRRERPLCTLCEMIVFWIQVQLKQKNAKEKIFEFIDEVIVLRRTNLFILLWDTF